MPRQLLTLEAVQITPGTGGWHSTADQKNIKSFDSKVKVTNAWLNVIRSLPNMKAYNNLCVVPGGRIGREEHAVYVLYDAYQQGPGNSADVVIRVYIEIEGDLTEAQLKEIAES